MKGRRLISGELRKVVVSKIVSGGVVDILLTKPDYLILSLTQL